MPERIPELREEIETVIASDGWTKAALGKMWKLDSVFRETLRHHSLSLGSCFCILISRSSGAIADGSFAPISRAHTEGNEGRHPQ